MISKTEEKELPSVENVVQKRYDVFYRNVIDELYDQGHFTVNIPFIVEHSGQDLIRGLINELENKGWEVTHEGTKLEVWPK